MSLTLALLLVLGGLALLTAGGELLVRGATAIARVAGLTPAVIGLTVVAMGTSLPELVVSVTAAIQGQPDIAVGNVVGSNIFNLTATLGLTAMILPLPVHGSAVRLEWPFMFVASCVTFLLARDGLLDGLEGGFLVISLALFTAYAVRIARREVDDAERAQLTAVVDARNIPPRPRRLLLALGAVAAGMVLLVAGGRLLVDGAVALARLAGMTERVIGLTVVAAGTGAPELATSLVAAYRRRTDVAVANLIGSNIFNLLGILGVTALIGGVPVSDAILATDFWWMIGTSLLLLPLLRTNYVVGRVEGAVLAAVYVVYVGTLLGGQ